MPAPSPRGGGRAPNRSSRSTHTSRPTSNKSAGSGGSNGRGSGPSEAEHEILFQDYFKSVGPRTYAAQVKRANNGNHYLVLLEGKRDEKTNEVRKDRVFVYSEDFIEFFKLMKKTAEFIKANPVPEEVKKKRERFWAKQAAEAPRDPKSLPERAAKPATEAPAPPQPQAITSPAIGAGDGSGRGAPHSPVAAPAPADEPGQPAADTSAAPPNGRAEPPTRYHKVDADRFSSKKRVVPRHNW